MSWREKQLNKLLDKTFSVELFVLVWSGMTAAKKLRRTRSELSTSNDKRTTLKTQSAPSSLFCRGFMMLLSFRGGEGNSSIDNVGQDMKAAKTKSTKGCIITPNWKSFPFLLCATEWGMNSLFDLRLRQQRRTRGDSKRVWNWQVMPERVTKCEEQF